MEEPDPWVILYPKIRRGEPEALAELYEILYKKTRKQLAKYILGKGGIMEDVDIVMHEGFLRLYMKILDDSYEKMFENMTRKDVCKYYHGICINIWKDELKKKKKHRAEDIPPNWEEPGNVHRKLEKEEQERQLHQCIGDLSKKCQDLLEGFYFSGMSLEDIAEKLGYKNGNSAKTAKERCMKVLRKCMGRKKRKNG